MTDLIDRVAQHMWAKFYEPLKRLDDWAQVDDVEKNHWRDVVRAGADELREGGQIPSPGRVAGESDPATQFQIGDRVLYVPEGVRTEVIGYLWIEEFGASPKIGGYTLLCGVTVGGEDLRREDRVRART